MTGYRYELEKYTGMDSRYNCPACGKNKEFTRYIDTATGVQVGANVGICNRKSNCGYHYTPAQYFKDNNVKPERKFRFKKPAPQIKHVFYIQFSTFEKSLCKYEANHFVTYLNNILGAEKTKELIGRYYIGTSGKWPGATIYWQIDTSGRIRTGKIMLYNPITGKRVKEPYNHIAWVHKAEIQPEYQLKQCLFGEHLLKTNNKPVAIVEAEKTAIIASGYLPQYLWLACGSLTNLNADMCKILKGRNVTLYPDLKGFETWSKQAEKLSHFARIKVSDYLEQVASPEEKKQGLDIADYLAKTKILKL